MFFHTGVFGQFVRFCTAGAFSASFTVLVPVILHEIFNVRQEIAVAISLASIFIINFFLMRLFVFNSDGARRKQAVSYAITAILFRSGEYLYFLLLFNYFGIHYVVALATVLVSVTVIKFMTYRFFVFGTAPVTGIDLNPPTENLAAANRTYHIVQDHMRLLPNYYAWTYGRVKQYLRGNVIELGCGAGFGIRTYLDNADRVYAVDHSDELLADLRSSYGSDKVQTIQADLIDGWDRLSLQPADAAVMMDVIEHFKDDIGFLKQAARFIKPGGHLIIKVPAHKKLYGAIDAASGHYRRYDTADIEMLARDLGLRIAYIGQINMPGYLAYGFKKNKSSNFSQTFSPGQLRWINRAMPLIAFGDAVLRAILGPFYKGLSVVAVLEV